MAKKPTPQKTSDLEANLAKAVGATAPTATPETPKSKSPGRFNVAPLPATPPSYDEQILKLPVQEGSPCQVKGCPGGYSILQTRRAGTQLVRDYICRTCQKTPKDPHAK